LGGITGSYGNSAFNFLGNCQSLSMALAPVYILLSAVWGPQLVHVIANICFLCSSHLSVYEVLSHCNFFFWDEVLLCCLGWP
jgi:hypothetical protein